MSVLPPPPRLCLFFAFFAKLTKKKIGADEKKLHFVGPGFAGVAYYTRNQAARDPSLKKEEPPPLFFQGRCPPDGDGR